MPAGSVAAQAATALSHSAEFKLRPQHTTGLAQHVGQKLQLYAVIHTATPLLVGAGAGYSGDAAQEELQKIMDYKDTVLLSRGQRKPTCVKVGFARLDDPNWVFRMTSLVLQGKPKDIYCLGVLKEGRPN